MGQKISKNELRGVLRLYFSDAKTEHERELAFKSFLFYVGKKSQFLDDDATNFISKIGDIFIEHLDESANSMVDGENKRKIKRQVAIARGEHFSFENIVRNLYQEPKTNLEINKLTHDIFLKLGQVILDFLYDIPKNGVKKDDYVVLTLFHSGIDELLTSFHLAQHGFASQSFHHSRTVLEIIDMVELFSREPSLVKKWSDDSIASKKRWDEFSPGEVRKKLKKDKDETYNFMSEIGTHITAYYMKPRVSEEIEIGEKLKKKVTVRLGGSSQDWACVSANTACIHATLLLINQLAKNFESYLSEEEVIKKLIGITEDYKNYVLNGFVKFSKQKGHKTAEVEAFIEKIKIDE